jgi:uncharacterized membrane protein
MYLWLTATIPLINNITVTFQIFPFFKIYYSKFRDIFSRRPSYIYISLRIYQHTGIYFVTALSLFKPNFIVYFLQCSTGDFDVEIFFRIPKIIYTITLCTFFVPACSV